VQMDGFPIDCKQLQRARATCGADRNVRKNAAPLKLTRDSRVCDFLRGHTDTKHKDLLPLVNAEFIGVRAAADGAGRGFGAGGAAHPRARLGVCRCRGRRTALSGGARVGALGAGPNPKVPSLGRPRRWLPSQRAAVSPAGSGVQVPGSAAGS
jgi:hypothetical protein